MSTKTFNYDSLDSKARNEAKKHAEQINKLLRSSAESVVEIGRRLNAVRESMTSSTFRLWIECEFRWQQSTAANYMQSARVFGELDCLSKFQPHALILLARSNVPERISKSMIEAARAGNIITSTMVRKALAEDEDFKPKRKDAGVGRKDTPRSIGTSKSGDSRAVTVATLVECLDAFTANIQALSIEAGERDALAQRFFEMAVRLKSQPIAAQPQKKTKRTQESKHESRELVGV